MEQQQQKNSLEDIEGKINLLIQDFEVRELIGDGVIELRHRYIEDLVIEVELTSDAEEVFEESLRSVIAP